MGATVKSNSAPKRLVRGPWNAVNLLVSATEQASSSTLRGRKCVAVGDGCGETTVPSQFNMLAPPITTAL
jgi:hypothetical protein